jgi:hypothetical protein
MKTLIALSFLSLGLSFGLLVSSGAYAGSSQPSPAPAANCTTLQVCSLNCPQYCPNGGALTEPAPQTGAAAAPTSSTLPVQAAPAAAAPVVTPEAK